MATKGQDRAATIGFFDGVHRGHAFLVQQLCIQATKRGLQPLVITFDHHPRQVLHSDWQPQLLTLPEEKVLLLQGCQRLTPTPTLTREGSAYGMQGCQHPAPTPTLARDGSAYGMQGCQHPTLAPTLARDGSAYGMPDAGNVEVAMLHFDEQMALLSARDFMQQVLAEQMGVRLLLTGYDNHFGHRTSTSCEGFSQYVDYGRELGIEVVQAEPLVEQGRAVSSSLIRRLLGVGEVEEAARCLGRYYELHGTVEHGRQRGREMGFPTANLRLDSPLRLVPAKGVYAVWATIGTDGSHTYPAMTNIGTRPTFDGHRLTIETHIFNISANLYGEPLSLAFVSRLRGEQHFGSADELARQMQMDADAANALLQPRL